MEGPRQGDAAGFPKIPEGEPRSIRRERELLLDFIRNESTFLVSGLFHRMKNLVRLAGQKGGIVFVFYAEAQQAFRDQKGCMSPEVMRRAAIEYFGGDAVIRAGAA